MGSRRSSSASTWARSRPGRRSRRAGASSICGGCSPPRFAGGAASGATSRAAARQRAATCCSPTGPTPPAARRRRPSTSRWSGIERRRGGREHVMRQTRQQRGELSEAGELAPVEAIDRGGLTITSDGAFVRVLAVTPPNPLILADEDRQAVAAGFCHLIGRLRADQWLQFYPAARRLRPAARLADAQREVEAAAGPPPAGGHARDATA